MTTNLLGLQIYVGSRPEVMIYRHWHDRVPGTLTVMIRATTTFILPLLGFSPLRHPSSLEGRHHLP